MIPEELTKDLQYLKECGYTYEIVEEGQRIYIIFKGFPLPAGLYSCEKIDLMIFTTQFYPNAGFDMFWVDEGLKLKSGNLPRNGEALETYMGKRWQRFSYHPYSAKPWNPSEDSITSFIGNVQKRLTNGD